MSKSSKPRKKYRPKYTEEQMRSAPNDVIFSRSEEEVSSDAAKGIIYALRVSLQALIDGTASATDYNALSAAANVAIILCEKGVGSEHYDECSAASRVLARCRYQYAETGVFQIPASDAKTVAEMLDVREAQFLAEGYTAGIDYQAASIASSRLKEGNVIKPEDLVEAP